MLKYIQQKCQFPCRVFVSRRLFHLMSTPNRFEFVHVFSKVVQQLFMKYLIKKMNSFSICKYAKTVNFCSSYALVDGSLESRTPC